MQLLAQSIVWFSVARATHSGRACRDYVIFDSTGSACFEARAFPWRREIVIRANTPPHLPVLTLRRRRSFPLTGTVDILNEDGDRIGTVRRNGVFRAQDRHVGRFLDARTMRERTREAVVIGVLDSLFGGDGTTAIGSAPNGFVWLRGSTVVGVLTRAAASFLAESPHTEANRDTTRPHASAYPSLIARVIDRFRRLARPDAPRAWKLEQRDPAHAADDRIVIAAALFTIELSQW